MVATCEKPQSQSLKFSTAAAKVKFQSESVVR
jgi:hypothetical protein